MDILQNNKPGQKIQDWGSIDYWSKIGLSLFIFTMPFVSAFAFSGTISIPLIIALFLFAAMWLKIIQTGAIPAGFFGFDLIIIGLFILWVIFSFCVNGLGNAKSLNHTVAYISTFLLFYITIKFTLFSVGAQRSILKWVLALITFTTIVNALFACTEFITSNLFDINLNDYIPRPSEEEAFYNALSFDLLSRARGFAPESGHFTFMMELFFPFTLYYLFFSNYCTINRGLKIAFTVIIILSIISGVSSATFIIIPVAFLMAVVIYARQVVAYLKRRLVQFSLFILGVLGAIVAISYFLPLYSFILLSVSDKVDSVSYIDRKDRIDFFFYHFSKQDIIHKLCGVGPAGFNVLGFDESKSILSLYYSITFELGFIGSTLIVLLFSYFILYSVKGWTKMGFFSLVSVLSGIMHYYFIANYWYPWFWFVGAFVIFSQKEVHE